MLIPIALLPDWLQTVASLLPIQAIYSVPLAILLGKSDGADPGSASLLQLGWIVVLWALAMVLWRLAAPVRGGRTMTRSSRRPPPLRGASMLGASGRLASPCDGDVTVLADRDATRGSTRPACGTAWPASWSSGPASR